jgi:hypothetical protein
MKIQKKLFTFSDAWPWALILALVTALTAVAISAIVKDKTDPDSFAKGLITVLVAVSFASMIAYRYDERYLAISKWNQAFQTNQGTAIAPDISSYSLFKSAGWYLPVQFGFSSQYENPVYLDIQNEIDNCIKFWSGYCKVSSGTIYSAFSGATISIVSAPFVATFYSRLLVGSTQGNNIQVVYDGNVIKTKETFIGLVRHEVSHLCLGVCGVPDDQQHSMMTASNFC